MSIVITLLNWKIQIHKSYFFNKEKNAQLHTFLGQVIFLLPKKNFKIKFFFLTLLQSEFGFLDFELNFEEAVIMVNL